MIRCYICHNCHYHAWPFRESVKRDIPVICPNCHALMERDKVLEGAYKNSNRDDVEEQDV